MKHRLLFYPVANGDTTLFVLRDSTTILVDCKLRAKAEDPDDPTCFDVKQDLLDRVNRRNSNPYLDVFILTHPDQDHCHGFSKNFYQGDPKDYSKSNRENDEILIDELWVTSMLFSNGHCEDAKSLKREAERRKKLKESNHPDCEKPGNRIRMVGYDGNKKFENLISYVPGNPPVTTFNGMEKTDFGMFIHAPFKDDLIDGRAEKDKNMTSIVFNACFKVEGKTVCRVLMGGDADHYNWEQILAKSKKHGNTDHLVYNIFLAPHHCSWTYFNDVPYEANESNKTPKDYALEVLDYGEPEAYIIASSKKISDADKNPPHYAAKVQYLKKVDGKEYFLNTAVEPSEKEPKPIEFVIDKSGLSRVEEPSEYNKVSALAGLSSSGFKPWAY